MTDYNRFSEHFRIDQYLKRKSTKGLKNISLKKNENTLSNFTIGLIIITKEENYEDKLEFINEYACKLFRIEENANIKELKEKFNEFVKLKNNSTKTSMTLKDIIFNYSSFNLELDNFIPFESKYSKNIILYIKINEIGEEKYIVIDKYDKYIEERKYIELNLIKAINYQYLHTLYHELNNPLNALLALSGERSQLISSEISNIERNDFKPPMLSRKKTIRSKKYNNYNNNNFKKERNSGIVSLSPDKYASNQQDILECKTKRRSMIDNSLNDKIPLLINIIKIFIKNFILYLKTRADNLLMIKNEYGQNETSDIMNAVEVSEYEKELTRHKKVKINLEYIFDLYLNKFLCLFKYKEIEFETNFEKLKNIFVVTDEFNFIYYIRQIYTFLYYVVPKKEGFAFDYEEENNIIKIIIKKKNNEDITKIIDENLITNSKDNNRDMSQIIQTKEMTKEVLYSMTKRLNFSLEIYDKETSFKNNSNINDNNIYLIITMPIHKKDKSEEDDEFKDEDINEMIQNENFILEDKLKRQFQNYSYYERKSNNSNNNIIDIIDKKKDNKKENNESFNSFHDKEIDIKKDLNDNTKNIKKNSENNLSINNENQKKTSLLNSKDNDNFLNKCLKISENKKLEKDNFLKINHLSQKVKNHCSDKNVLYSNLIKNSDNENKSQKLSGIFTKINNFRYSVELKSNDKLISNNTDNKSQNNQKDELIPKNNENNVSKGNQLNNQINLKIVTEQPSSPNFKTIQTKNNSKNKKNSFVISNLILEEDDNKKISINISNNNIINIINNNNNKINEFSHKDLKPENLVSFTENNNGEKKNEKNSLEGGTSLNKNKKKVKLKNLPEIDNKNQKRFSQNISQENNPKYCMTFFSSEKKENVSKDKKTILNESIKENETLFIAANKERKMHLQKSEKKNNNFSNNLIQDNELGEEEEEQEEQEEQEEEDQEEENEEINENNIQEEDQFKCNCTDLLIVDDEKFNVIAAQRMIKNIGYESDAAYNGEECLNLILEKKKLNCQCNKNYYKIIFLDIVMPVLEGIQTAKKIQEMIDKKEINENIKIVFISGNIDGKGIKNSLLEIDCVKECLQKPVGIDKYKKILEKYYKSI